MHNSSIVHSNKQEPSVAHLFRSPLKRPRPPIDTKVYETLKAEHLGYEIQHLQKEARPLKRRAFVISSQTLNKINTENIPESLRVVVEAIEETANIKKIANLALTELRHRVLRILDNDQLTEDLKLAELGLIYFYLTTNKTVPISSSLLEARMEEIEKEALILLEEHKSVCFDKKTIPSGSIHYIQRAFAHMIFTPEGNFNKGGCLAVLQLLKSRLALLLSEEQKDQIKIITKQLLRNKEFLALFMEPFTVDSYLENFIVIDLKVCLRDELPWSFVQWALLLNLFSIVCQRDDGDCYVISTYSNFLTEKCLLLLKMTVDALKNGVLEFEGVKIPISLILRGKIKSESVLDLKMTSSEAFSLTPFAVAKELIPISNNPPLDPTSEFQLKKIIERTFEPYSETAKKIFAGHKHNYIQRIMLSILQFIAKNNRSNCYKLLTVRDRWLDVVIKVYEETFCEILKTEWLDNDPFVLDFLQRLKDHIRSKHFVIDGRNWRYYIEDGRQFYDYHPVGFQLTTTRYKGRPYLFVTRLFCNNQGKLKAIDRLSELSESLAACVDEVVRDDDSRTLTATQSLLKDHFRSPDFQENIARMLEKLNKLKDITLDWKTYVDSDSFFLSTNGASFGLITEFDGIKGNFSKITFSSENCNEFWQNIRSHLLDFMTAHPESSKKSPSQILIRHPGHAFNLTPHRFLEFFDGEKDVIQETIVGPANALLASEISVEQRKRIIVLFEGQKKLNDYQHLFSQSMTAEEFKIQMLTELNESKHAKFKTAFHCGMQKVPYMHFKAAISNVLMKVGRELTQLEEKQIRSYIHLKRKETSFSPAKAALLLRRALLSVNPPIHIPAFKLERSIRSQFSLPQAILLAKLNWIDKDVENPIYIDLLLNFDFSESVLTISQRDKGIDSTYKSLDNLLKQTDLLLPKTV